MDGGLGGGGFHGRGIAEERRNWQSPMLHVQIVAE